MFTGRRYDLETGFYYYRARYYDPYTGRFLQTDPIGYSDGLGWYSYCDNNPIKYIDPSGTSLTAAEYADIYDAFIYDACDVYNDYWPYPTTEDEVFYRFKSYVFNYYTVNPSMVPDPCESVTLNLIDAGKTINLVFTAYDATKWFSKSVTKTVKITKKDVAKLTLSGLIDYGLDIAKEKYYSFYEDYLNNLKEMPYIMAHIKVDKYKRTKINVPWYKRLFGGPKSYWETKRVGRKNKIFDVESHVDSIHNLSNRELGAGIFFTYEDAVEAAEMARNLFCVN